MKRKSIQCTWDNCAQEFGNTVDYRRHCFGHIEAHIVAAGFQINLPAETWTEVLARCGQRSLAKRVSLSRYQFHAIARPMIDGGSRGRILPRMTFLKRPKTAGDDVVLVKVIKRDKDGAQQPVELPIAEVAPPQNVTHFSRIMLNYIDAKVLSFFCAIRPLLTDICMELGLYSCPLKAENHDLYNWKSPQDQHNVAALECLLRVFSQRAITSLTFFSGTYLISAELLDRVLAIVRHLRIYCTICSDPSRHQSPIATDDGTYTSDFPKLPVLVKWLHSGATNGQPKMASLNIGCAANFVEFVKQAKQHLLSAATPNPYLVAIFWKTFKWAERADLPFTTLRNEHTGEVLTLRHQIQVLVFGCFRHNYVLYRRQRSTSTEEESSKGAELHTVPQSLSRKLFAVKSLRNKLVLSVGEIGKIDESSFPMDSQDGPQDGTGGSGPSTSSSAV